MTRQFLIFLLIGAIFFFALFALWPQVDLDAAALFYRSGDFVGRSPVGEAFRRFFYDAPYLLLAALLLAAVPRALGWTARGPSGRAVVFLLATLALGPGLLVNGVLKEISHRPRPEQTKAFGGPWAFQPIGSFSGQCRRNCSFVSGEVATAAWTLAPALLAPPPARAAAVIAAALFTLDTAAERMAFGGHYLSDVLFAALFTFAIVLVSYQWYRRGEKAKD
ncbi:phosphatase PAP2 family protein [Rhodoblastus sp.]|uniref:phosphatase PAP2 family protein n=1 Tax=Rhodoblastus sp. TaxID=1962975 RepID=UPI003F9D9F8B